MSIWDIFWSKNKNTNAFYLIGRFLPAGPWDFFWRWKRYDIFLREIKIKNPRILEIGCGTGVMTFKMLENLGGKAVLVDKSKSALDVAKKHSKMFNIEKGSVKYVAEDIFSYDDEMFDIVHSQGLIEHFKDQSKIIKEHVRLAKKDGYIIILAPRPSLFYRSLKKAFEYYHKKWLFGYESPMETDRVVDLIRRNDVHILKKRNFIFSMGCLSQKR